MPGTAAAHGGTAGRGAKICVVGHITMDRITIPGRQTRTQPGGTAVYAAAALKALDQAVEVVTRLAAADEACLLADLRSAGIEVRVRPSAESTKFENIYHGPGLSTRSQRVESVAAPFAPGDLEGLEAGVFYLGPLTSAEMPVPFVEAAAARGTLVALDVQGYTRRIAGGGVRLARFPETEALLPLVHILKADDDEARILTGREDPAEAARALADLGAREVLVTADAAGSVVYRDGKLYRIPAFPPARVVDATGCGDSYLAGYVFHRRTSDDPEAAGRFAAALASLKLEQHGPFRGSAAEAFARAALEP